MEGEEERVAAVDSLFRLDGLVAAQCARSQPQNGQRVGRADIQREAHLAGGEVCWSGDHNALQLPQVRREGLQFESRGEKMR